MAEVTFKLDNKEFMAKIDRMSTVFKSYKQPLDSAGADLVQYFSSDVMNAQGTETGGAWKPLSASTIEARAMRQGYYANDPVETGKILIWTGRLRAGFQKEAQNLKLRIFNTNENFKYNQPKRPMLAITPRLISIVTTKLTDFINATMN
jgi:hypothetical protein